MFNRNLFSLGLVQATLIRVQNILGGFDQGSVHRWWVIIRVRAELWYSFTRIVWVCFDSVRVIGVRVWSGANAHVHFGRKLSSLSWR